MTNDNNSKNNGNGDLEAATILIEVRKLLQQKHNYDRTGNTYWTGYSRLEICLRRLTELYDYCSPEIQTELRKAALASVVVENKKI